MEIDKRLSAGSDFVLYRLPGGGHLLVLRSGENGRDEQQIITLLMKQMPEGLARDILESHKSECRNVDLTALVVSGYEITSSIGPSTN